MTLVQWEISFIFKGLKYLFQWVGQEKNDSSIISEPQCVSIEAPVLDTIRQNNWMHYVFVELVLTVTAYRIIMQVWNRKNINTCNAFLVQQTPSAWHTLSVNVTSVL